MILSAPYSLPKIDGAIKKKLAPIAMLIVAAIIQLIWTSTHGYRFDGFLTSFLGTALLLAVALAYGVSGRSIALSNMAYFAALWIAFSIIGAIATYNFAALNYPLLDADFDTMDKALGFDWLSFYQFVEGEAWLSTILKIAYDSLLPQIAILVLYLSSLGKHNQSYELWWSAVIALTATALLSGLFPAAGTFAHYGVGIDRAVHLVHFHQLREGAHIVYAIPQMQGIITFPSYHVVLAILLTNAFSNTKLFLVAGAFNIVMLIATPIYGGHYLVDMIAGAVIAVASLWCVRRYAKSGT